MSNEKSHIALLYTRFHSLSVRSVVKSVCEVCLLDVYVDSIRVLFGLFDFISFD